MTLKKILQMSLRRVGLSQSSAAYLSQARDYFNLGKDEILQERKWNTALKSSTLTTVAAQRSYSLASDVMWPKKDSFRDQTNDRPLHVIDLTETDARDPDEDESGQQLRVVITGIHATTGYWTVELFPTPDTSSETIAYRYYKAIADKTVTDDDTDLAADFPAWQQRGLIFYVSGLFKGEKGDLDGEAQDMSIFQSILNKNVDADTEVDDLKPVRLGRRDDSYSSTFSFEVQSGSLS